VKFYSVENSNQWRAEGGGRTEPRPQASKSRGASKKWNYKDWNVV